MKSVTVVAEPVAAPPAHARPLTILDLRDTYEIGGPGKTIIETFHAIDARRFRLHLGVFATRRETEETPFVKAARAAGMPVHLVRGFNQYDPRLVWRIARLVRSLNVDIVHAHEVKSDVLTCLAAKLQPVPIMTTLHGWIGNSPKQRLMTALDRRAVRAFDCVVVVSRQMWDQVALDGFRPGQLRLLRNAIAIEKYRRTGQTGFLAAILGHPVKGPVLSCIGRLSAEKGQADLIEAVALVRARGKHVSVVLAGDGPERSAIEERVRALDLSSTVHFAGHVDQPHRILEETALAVLPSHAEGLPNAALEALAMNVPLLATNVGGTPEVVTDGETGRLVEPGSPRALADGILDFLNDPPKWHGMAARGREMVEREFNFQTRTRELEAIYAGLLAERHA
jgi:glycosyltransferase involved in cell wall biosynthesis